MHRVVFLDRATLDTHLRSPRFEHAWTDHSSTPLEVVAERLAGATICVTNKAPITRETLASCPDLELVAVAATGTDNVDLEACRERGVVVCNVSGYAARSVAEHVLGGLFALRRNLFAYRRAVQKGAWQRAEVFAAHLFPIADLTGATLGIYGYGQIGRALEARAGALGMQVRLVERKGAAEVRPGRVPFEAALEELEILSLHCPLDGNAGLVGAEEIARMRSDAILVNTARGALVDHAALRHALLEGRLGGAILDVWPEEPPSAEDPLLALDLPNLVVTPHVAWASRDTQHDLANRVIEVLEAFAAGAPVGRVA